MSRIVFFLLLFACVSLHAQTTLDMKPTADLPFRQIPEAPADYSAHAVTARMIEGLGYRYYWATEKLRTEDLAYKPSEDSRTAGETLDHLFGLSKTILNGFKQQPNVRPAPKQTLTFEQKRAQTLLNLHEASELLRKQTAPMEDYKIAFKRGERSSEFPLWNMYNGPIADAIYHVGQIVAYRRASGNPMDSRVNVFMGKNRE
ncbi:MAG: hypothetical protein AAF798_13190 [Bacteroidota bacterium]